MRKLFALWTLLCVFSISHAQVGIGTDNPDPSTAMHITNEGTPNKGVLIAPMTKEQRDAMIIPPEGLPNGLMIFNTTENCFNYSLNGKWRSLCGEYQQAAAEISPDQDWDEQVFGNYFSGTPTTASNYVEIKLTVVEEGKIGINIITGNGYSFSYSNDLISEGDHTIRLYASGTPAKTGVDNGIISIGG